MSVRRVALLTAGGYAPCLSSAIGGLIERYTQLAPEVEIIAYKHGYQGLLTGDYLTVTDTVRLDLLHRGGTVARLDGSARGALDAALSSPSGLAVAVDDDGRVRGVLRPEDVLAAIEHVRREREAGR